MTTPDEKILDKSTAVNPPDHWQSREYEICAGSDTLRVDIRIRRVEGGWQLVRSSWRE